VIPPAANVYSTFLDFLISRNQPAAAASVWSRIVELHQAVESRYVFDYIRYLIAERDVAQARRVWQQAAAICEISNYQPSPVNLVVNGDFSLPLLNAGFDWLHEKPPGISFALDPTESHLGARSLLISFAGATIEDVGIQQLVPVEPNTRYDFSAWFKAPHMEGAGGAKFSVRDFYSGTSFFLSDDLKNAEVWKPASGTFTTGPDTKLLVIDLRRIPAGSPIRGNLWIGSVHLAASSRETRQ
jgi:hypothetical protein